MAKVNEQAVTQDTEQVNTNLVSQMRREYLHTLLLGSLGISGLLGLFLGTTALTQGPTFAPLVLAPFGFILLTSFAALRLMEKKEFLKPPLYLLLVGLLIGMGLLMRYGAEYNLVIRHIAPFMLILVAAIAGVMLPIGESISVTIVGAIWTIIVSLLTSRAGLDSIAPYDWAAILISGLINGVTVVTSGSLYLMAQYSTESYLTAQRRADEFFENKEQLRKALATQEWLNNQLKETNRALATSTEVGRQVTSILRLDDLLPQVVTLIQENFNYYFVGIWLPDEKSDMLVLNAGARMGGSRVPLRGLRISQKTQSIVVSVYQQGRYRRVDNINSEPDYLPLTELPDTRSELALPLLFGDETIGVLDIQHTQTNVFNDDARAVMQALANQISIAIRNAQLYTAEQSRRQLAESLEQTARVLSGSLNLSEVPGRILDQLAAVVPYGRGSVLIREGDTLHSIAQRGYPRSYQDTGFEIAIRSGDLFEQIVASQAPLLIADTVRDERYQQTPGLDIHHSFLGAPLISKERVVGIISLTRHEAGAFTPADTQLVMAFTGQAAIALENARLVDEIRRFNEQLEQMVAERTEALNKAYTTLEKMDKNKTDFIQVTAHELRTPLTVIRGYTQVIKSRLPDSGDTTSQQMLDGILSGTDRLHAIVNSMLDIARIDNQTLTAAKRPVNLHDIFVQVATGYQKPLQERRLSLTNATQDLPTIMADGPLLHRAMDELLSNAIKYTPDGGRITISGQEITHNGIPYLQITLSDSGIGIDPENQELIFEKFYQLGEVASHSSGRTKFKGGGPGLGLAIAKGIIEAHGGRIWAESPGCDETQCPGSSFHVLLPK